MDKKGQLDGLAGKILWIVVFIILSLGAYYLIKRLTG